MPKKNIVGEQIRKSRYERGWTQEAFVAHCNVLGWGLSRSTLAKIEARVRRVSDAELFVLAKALKVTIESLYPRKEKRIIELVK